MKSNVLFWLGGLFSLVLLVACGSGRVDITGDPEPIGEIVNVSSEELDAIFLKGGIKADIKIMSANPVPRSAMPVTLGSDHSFEICVAGFNEGNHVSVSVPWSGSPERHSVLGYGEFVGSTGGFCFTAPPDWTHIMLEPGEYPLRVNWYESNRSYRGYRIRKVPSIVVAP